MINGKPSFRFSVKVVSLLVFISAVLWLGGGGLARAESIDNTELLMQVYAQSTNDVLTAQSQRGLAHFYHDLGELKAGLRSQVQILQLGDSHTAGGFFSGKLRQLLQGRYGNAGRGMMPPGVVYNGLKYTDIKPTQDKNWDIANSLKSPDRGPYSISGFVATSTRAGATMQLTAVTTDDKFDRVDVDYLMHAGGGQFVVAIDGIRMATVSTLGKEGQEGHFAMDLPRRSLSMSVEALQKGVSITAWGTERRDRGIILTSYGVVGATALLQEHWDPEMVAWDVRRLHPSLIILEYGTNEGFGENLNATKYAESFSGLLKNLQRLVPAASILVVGPPDSERASPSCHSGLFGRMFSCRWRTPQALDEVRNIERQAAADADADFWDWAGIMPNGIAPWVKGGWARADHVHFTPPGYEAAAGQLFMRLMKGYAYAKKSRR